MKSVNMNEYTELVLSYVAEDADGSCRVVEEKKDATFMSLYGKKKDGTSEVILDAYSMEAALDVAMLIAGKYVLKLTL